MSLPLLITTACFGLAATISNAQDWPQWRGPSRDGKFSGAKWPENLSGLKERWRVEMGKSYSGPIVVGNRVFTTESRDKTYEIVRAMDRNSGKELWQVQWEGYQKVPFFAASNGDWIRSTPACDGNLLFVAGMRDVLVALDVESGKEKWRLDFVKKFGADVPAFGFVCSPLIVGDFIYVQAGAAFCKVKKATGEVVWRSLEDGGGMWGSAFSSPVAAEIGGADQLLVQTREKLCGVDPADGKMLWSEKIPAFRGMNILTPVVSGSRIFTSSYGGKTLAFDLRKNDGALKLETAWEHKTEGYMSTPVVIAGKVFLHQRNQRFSCFDLATGQQHWVTDQKFGKYMSLAAQGDRILALDERGILLLIRANPAQFQLIDQKKISDQETWAHLAVSGKQLFIRELQALTCLEWK